MQKFRMLKTAHGVRKGKLHPEQFAEGETYHIDQDLGEQFIELGVVELADQGDPEEKAKPSAPANKAIAASPSNKTKKAE